MRVDLMNLLHCGRSEGHRLQIDFHALITGAPKILNLEPSLQSPANHNLVLGLVTGEEHDRLHYPIALCGTQVVRKLAAMLFPRHRIAHVPIGVERVPVTPQKVPSAAKKAYSSV